MIWAVYLKFSDTFSE